jgi:RNA polymerase sigma factor (sigma-70 family)
MSVRKTRSGVFWLRVLHQVADPELSTPAERFDAVFARFYPELFGLTYRVLGERMATEDALQEAFLRLSRDARLLGRPDVEIGAWLRRVALNLAFNQLRSQRRDRARLEHVDHAPPGELGPPEALLRREEQLEVRRALADLPERQRACLLLRHSGYAYAEIADTLGIAIGSVGVLLARAEAAFRTTYRRHTPS